jgi:hypothetical protein
MEREAVTIRIPADLLEQARQLGEGSESFNEMVVVAICLRHAARSLVRCDDGEV